MNRYHILLLAGQNEIMQLVRMANNDTGFDHKAWSIWDAEQLEALAKLIRSGYERDAYQSCLE